MDPLTQPRPVTPEDPIIERLLLLPAVATGSALRWQQDSSTIWVATHTGCQQVDGIVTERRPGQFTTISATCQDLGAYPTLSAAQAALEEHPPPVLRIVGDLDSY